MMRLYFPLPAEEKPLPLNCFTDCYFTKDLDESIQRDDVATRMSQKERSISMEKEEEEHEERLDRCFALPAPSSPPSGSLTQTQSLRVASTHALMDAVNVALPPPPLVPSSPLPPLPPSLYIPPVDRRADIPEIELPPRKRLYTMTTPIRRQRGIAEVGYGIREAWVHPIEVVPVVAPVTLGGVNDKVTELAEIQENDIQDLDPHPCSGDASPCSKDTPPVLVVRDSQADEGHADPAKSIAETAETRAMIDQALLRNSTNGDGSHSSDGDNQSPVQTAHPCFYADFMKCQPLNFKGTEGVVGLTRWIEKMESIFNINGYTIEN
ncbi:hypothetical protein Tco_1542028 [Tanacetum coccineum]